MRKISAVTGALDLLHFENPAGNPVEIFHGPRVGYHAPILPAFLTLKYLTY
jgi:hypothetical protein